MKFRKGQSVKSLLSFQDVVRKRVVSVGLAVLAGIFAPSCRKEPAPAPLPATCAKVERGTEEPIEDVTCAGKDTDDDGVDDAVDLCPTLKETSDGIEDKDGCPDPDQDQDGVVDTSDACPAQAGDPPDGCPVIDTDGDGLPNHLDACPTRPEDKDGVQDADGCPEGERGATVGALLRTVWREGVVTFRRGKPAMTEEGARVLAGLTDEIAGAPEDVALVEMTVTTHPRELKRRAKLKRVVDERMKSIVDALTALGLSERQLETKTVWLKRRAKRRPGEIAVVLSLENLAAERRLSPTADGGPTPAAPGEATESAPDAGVAATPEEDAPF